MNTDREIVTRKGLTRRVWERLGKKYTQREVSAILAAFYEVVLDVIYEGAKLYVYDKFAIHAQWIKENKNCFDPTRGRYQTVPGHYRLKITPQREFKELLQEMAAEREENEE